jgi:membrane fusion protein (multidrug efflux system)
MEPDGKANMRPVQTANWIGGDWIVTGGLKEGDAVIVDNLMKLRPGTLVKADEAAAPAAAARASVENSGAQNSAPAAAAH